MTLIKRAQPGDAEDAAGAQDNATVNIAPEPVGAEGVLAKMQRADIKRRRHAHSHGSDRLGLGWGASCGPKSARIKKKATSSVPAADCGWRSWDLAVRLKSGIQARLTVSDFLTKNIPSPFDADHCYRCRKSDTQLPSLLRRWGARGV